MHHQETKEEINPPESPHSNPLRSGSVGPVAALGACPWRKAGEVR
uniref:Uncharacterized protein n=1 Tax=Arundo donax TaxID=35708 RepID=A0A0A8Y000_ARUDO